MAVLIALPKHDYLKRSLTLKKPRNPLLKRILSSLFTVIQTRKVLFALWCFLSVLVLGQFVYELFCMNLLCFHLIVLSFYCQ